MCGSNNKYKEGRSMTKLRELYECGVCGNVVEVAHEGASALVCCNKPMKKLTAKTEDEGKEKHVPVVEETVNGVTIQVGSVGHPMEDKHYIKFIEVLKHDGVFRIELTPGQPPVADFPVDKGDVKSARAYCNLHGLWTA